MHQLSAKDEARDAPGSEDNEADAAQKDADRSKILTTKETFDTEDKHSRVNLFEEYDYGNLEAASEDADTPDHNVHLLIAKDEARDAAGSEDSEADAAQKDAGRSKITGCRLCRRLLKHPMNRRID